MPKEALRPRVEKYIIQEFERRKSGYLPFRSIVKMLEAKRIRANKITLMKVCKEIARDRGLLFRAGLCAPNYKRKAGDQIKLSLEEKIELWLKVKEHVKRCILVPIEEVAELTGYSVYQSIELVKIMSRCDPEGDRILLGKAKAKRGNRKVNLGVFLYYDDSAPLIEPIVPGSYPRVPEGVRSFLMDRDGEADFYEIAAALGVSVQYTRRIVKVLVERGDVEVERGVVRLKRGVVNLPPPNTT